MYNHQHLNGTRTHSMEGVRRSSRIARRSATADAADAKTKPTTTATPDSPADATTNPSVPPSDGTCPFMILPPELRLAIAEDVLNAFFTRLTLGLYPPYLAKGESQLPYTQELFSVLHVNRAFRLETINLCAKLAKDSAAEVVSHPPTNTYQSIRIGPHEQLKAKHKKILRILQQAKLSAGDAQTGAGDVRKDLLKALNTRGSGQPRSKGRRGRVRNRVWT